jgi:hypothetical protein
MLSSGTNVIICYKMLSSRAIVIMESSGANVIIWCYHVMLSSGMITHPFFIFPENFTHSIHGAFSSFQNRDLQHVISLLHGPQWHNTFGTYPHIIREFLDSHCNKLVYRGIKDEI